MDAIHRFFVLQIGYAQCRYCVSFLMQPILIKITVATVSATRLWCCLFCKSFGWADTTLSELMLGLLFNVVSPPSHIFCVALLRGTMQSSLPPILLWRVESSLCPSFLWMRFLLSCLRFLWYWDSNNMWLAFLCCHILDITVEFLFVVSSAVLEVSYQEGCFCSGAIFQTLLPCLVLFVLRWPKV